MTNQNLNITTRPWGTFEVLERGPGYEVKRLNIRQGQATSQQYHRHRSEHLFVVMGEGRIRRGTMDIRVCHGDSMDIPSLSIHRIENIGMGTLIIIEVWTGEELDEEDVVRLEDRYGRV